MKRTWKVVIADDEAIIREGIRGSVEWERLGLEVAGEAEDGEEALEKALQEQAAILLVDLSMPIMNGLTLIGHIRERLPLCKIIIITGHDEFSYAQEAIKLEVDDYILKPVNPAQLSEVLERVAKKIEATAAKEELLQMAAKQIEKNFALLRERFCLEWMEGELTGEEIEEQLAFLRMPEQAPDVVGVIRWPEQSKGKAFFSEKDRQLLLFAIENIVEECLQGYVHVHFRDQVGMIVLLIWGEPAESVFERIESSIDNYLKIAVVASFLPHSGGLEAVPAVYAEAKSGVSKDSRLSPFVRRAKEIIEARFGDPELTLEGVANELNVSAVYLSRIFKQESGASFVSLLTHTRIKAAIRLLGETELSMNEIAERVGYESQHYFSTSFKKVVGLPPMQYRKSSAGL
ncbi:AraC family transcriptional regulator [Paenibacillus darwinianus]|uniref:AraC family transcriptional regulator n=1 Tax=Paenibacillus darwinianus TaxID=1380763 RepID=A0A9W5RZ73_9BACL|nr:response regulator [Paenibacillus darwinianus]EXX84824.1 AraC family transcriptional regulator [Paenibacillus darwinianus]EXX84907.1 AraC family transcriptional regulator [Paenibacillus darwinianus]EXX85104.1 AraC family transcriptional regulator [Paenibacillus darwinianus]